MRRKYWSLLRIRTGPGSKARGLLLASPRVIPVVLGQAGIRANKREGDRASPAGQFRPLQLW